MSVSPWTITARFGPVIARIAVTARTACALLLMGIACPVGHGQITDAPVWSDLPERCDSAEQRDEEADECSVGSSDLKRSPAEGCDAVSASAGSPAADVAYRGTFYANSYNYLNDPGQDRRYLGDRLKALDAPGDGQVHLGGELRLRYHSETNLRGAGLTGRDDDFLLTRLRLFSDYRINERLRFYGEYLHADSGGETFPNRTIEVNRGEAQNLFVDIDFWKDSDGSLTGRFGRQELLYGNQRLLSPLDWANTRRTFDGYRLLHRGRDWDVDGFFVHPVKRLISNQGTNQWDGADTDTLFYGVYGTRKGLGSEQFEAYYLGIDYLTPGASLHTIGSRLVGEQVGLLYELEGGTQFGETGNGTSHSAGFATAGIGRKLDLAFRGFSWQPTVWVWYDYASGERDFAAVGRFDGGFDHLAPLAHKYNGFMDLFGRRNLHDLNAQLITPILGQRVSLLLWYHYFLLDNLTTPYNVNLTPFNPLVAAADRELGHELDVLFTINLTPRSNLQVGYSYFAAGDYYRQTSGGVAGANGIPSISDAHFCYMQYQLQF